MQHLVHTDKGLAITRVGELVNKIPNFRYVFTDMLLNSRVVCSIEDGTIFGVLSSFVKVLDEKYVNLFNSLRNVLNNPTADLGSKTFNLIAFIDAEPIVIRSIKATHIRQNLQGTYINFSCKVKKLDELPKTDRDNMMRYIETIVEDR